MDSGRNPLTDEGEKQSDNDGLAELSELELLKDLGGGEDEGVDDAGDGEGAADDGADRRHEVVQRRPRLVVLHSYRIQIVPEEKNLRFSNYVFRTEN